ncbi:MAG: SDR family oxidoreductase, partial [Gemmataceae bacterium]
HLHDRGDRVVGIARHAPDFDFPGKFVAGNLRDAQETERIFRRILETDVIDGVVNNVGWARPESIPELTLAAFWDVMSINLQPAILAAKIFTPKMIERGFGRVVNIASTVVLGAPGRSTYAAAKSALVSFTESWALELAKDRITVNAVAPGNTTTEGFRRNCLPGSDSEKRQIGRVPMGRLADPADVAVAVGFFLSEEAGFITGQTLFVDGGHSLRRV